MKPLFIQAVVYMTVFLVFGGARAAYAQQQEETVTYGAQSMTDEESVALAQRMQGQNQSATQVLKFLLADGRALDDAMVLVVSNSLSQDNQVAMTRAALCDPGATPATGPKAIAAAGGSEAVTFAVDRFDPRTCSEPVENAPPPSYLSADTPGRGGISPAN